MLWLIMKTLFIREGSEEGIMSFITEDPFGVAGPYKFF
jgi:hypothetical protein